MKARKPKDVKPVRYAYGVTTALLLGGAALSLATGLPAGAQVAQNDEARMEQVAPRAGAPASFANLTEQLQPAVVNISTRQRVQVNPDPFFAQFFGLGPQTRQAGALGTGFIISADGFVVTNNHVITMNNQGVAESIKVKLNNGEEYDARVIGRDMQSDVAVLKIDAGKPLPFVKFGDSGKARAGDWVLAIGNPFGLGGTVTAGIISNVFRNTGTGAYDHYIQTDASINSGNSGGPLFDMSGQVIGINTWIASPTGGNVGLGFAIPADIAKPIVEKLKSGAPIERGYLGFVVSPINEDLAASLGVDREKGEFVQSVQDGKPAQMAGIQPGDVIVRVDGKDVTPDQSVTGILFNTPPGKRIRIDVVRNGKPVSVTATVGRRPSEEELARTRINRGEDDQTQQQAPDDATADGVVEKQLGVAVTAMTPDIAGQLGFPPQTRGLVVVGVDPSSDAAEKGLKRPMVILEAGGKVMATKADLEAAIRAARAAGRDALLLRVQPPGNQAVFVPVRLKAQ
jgi:serine protease Do